MIDGMVTRFMGFGVGVARLVALSTVKVVDMMALYPSAGRGANHAKGRGAALPCRSSSGGRTLKIRLDGEAIGARVARLPGDQAGIARRGRQHLHIIAVEDVAHPAIDVDPVAVAEAQAQIVEAIASDVHVDGAGGVGREGSIPAANVRGSV